MDNLPHIRIESISAVQAVVYASNLIIWSAIFLYFKKGSQHYKIGGKVATIFIATMWTSVVFLTCLIAIYFAPLILGSGDHFIAPEWLWVLAYLPSQIAGLSLIKTLYWDK